MHEKTELNYTSDRCYRSNSSVRGSSLRPLGQCGSRASTDTASRQCSPIPESMESDISLLKEEVASLRKQFEELVTSQKGKWRCLSQFRNVDYKKIFVTCHVAPSERNVVRGYSRLFLSGT